MPTTFNAFYLGIPTNNQGNTILIDPTEGNRRVTDTDAENASQLVNQTFGSAQAPLWDNIVSFEAVNNGGNPTALDQDNYIANDQAIINGITFTFDAVTSYNVTINYVNGPPVTTTVVLAQMESGQLYLVPGLTPEANAALINGAIQSITVNSVVQNNAAGLQTDRPLLDFLCFTRGTRIETDRGAVPVEMLRPGDLVRTLDHGLQPLRWIGARSLSAAELAAAPHLCPVRIRAGALGAGLPLRDLTVSPQHRVLVRSKVAERMFGAPEVLVAAKHLTELDGIDQIEGASGVDYWHFLLDRHEVVFSEGARTESLFTGPEAMKALSPEARAEILTLFPELAQTPDIRPSARPLVNGRQGRSLAHRHAMNRMAPAA